MTRNKCCCNCQPRIRNVYIDIERLKTDHPEIYNRMVRDGVIK